ncbi:protein serine/threonine phosphatase [Crinalium epipsammum PCC 9333]|uniref:Protein serine/threonine phosphatase n=1 Tax=Crinalium epipsammum PCC 9333 TaxID=1173022 RepID=K9W0H0_9CYAN|nr:protein phosphatase 2C domain-containing protein [Crinalium epipsammum]AFZ13284.1 protein serine/threonine phosphatase [Crinalium epipsammum PCC 9333]
MQNPVATINCPNPQCQTPNPLDHNFCQKCRTPLIKRYLRAMGEVIDGDLGGAILVGRYLSKGNRILLDTQPSLPPETTEEIPEAIAPYLKLSPYKLHIPQVYGLIRRSHTRHPIWLLDQVPVYSGGVDSSVEGQLMPELAAAWKTAPALRQLNWLWQMAQLWHPLNTYNVTASLLTPGLLRVEGSIVRLLDLQQDNVTPTLQQLGELWSQWVEESQPVIKNFLAQLCQQLDTGEISHSDQLVALLERGIPECGSSQANAYQVATFSDTGPSRRRNEDSCYPPSGSISATQTNDLLTIVCDGIGGHEGGDIASSLAIETIRERVENLSANWDWHPTTVNLELEKSACIANDTISQRNDTEQRQERQRMGTTVVMALAHQYEIYITHVGDSRVYRVSRTGCHQVTLDDDLASREVRLGYALYREAVQHPASGSLVQALGMGASGMLHPTVQRFIVDEDCVFLLCTDGLSDYDRVEQYWETEILPILDNQLDLKTAAQRLVQIANSKNGHDNVTVALVHCQVKQGESTEHQLSAPAAASLAEDPSFGDPSRIKTQRLSSNPAPKRTGMLLGIFILMGLFGGVAYGFVSGLLPKIFLSSAPKQSPAISETPPQPPNDSSTPELGGRSLLLINSDTTKDASGKSIPLLLRPGFDQSNSKAVLGLIPANSVLQVSQKKQILEEKWLQLKVCSLPQIASKPSPAKSPQKPLPQLNQQAPAINKSSAVNQKNTSTGTYRLVQPGQLGWIRETEILPLSAENSTANTTQLGKCANPVSGSTASTPKRKPSASP